jgi:hypothetical protein
MRLRTPLPAEDFGLGSVRKGHLVWLPGRTCVVPGRTCVVFLPNLRRVFYHTLTCALLGLPKTPAPCVELVDPKVDLGDLHSLDDLQRRGKSGESVPLPRLSPPF